MVKQKISQFLNKDNLKILLISWVVAVTALAFIYQDTLSTQTESPAPMFPLDNISKEDTYRQQIPVYDNELSGLRVLFATYARANSGTITLSLKDDAFNEVQSWDIDTSAIRDNTYLDFNLDGKLTDCKDRTYYLDIDSTCEDGEAPTIYASWDGGASGLYRNDEPCGMSICYQLKYEHQASYLLNIRTILVTLLLLISLPAIMLIASKFFPRSKMYLIAFPQLAAVIGCHRILKHAMFGLFPEWLMALGFVLLCAFWVLGSIFIYRLLFIRNINLEKLSVLTLIVFSLLTIGFLTPGTGNDEQVHYAYAYKYSNALTFNGFKEKRNEEGKVMFDMRSEDAELLNSMTDVPNYINENSWKETAKNFRLFASDNSIHEYILKEVADLSSFGSNNVPLGYIASGIGIAIGRVLHLGALPTFYLGRIFNSALFILLVYFAIKTIPVGKETLFVISLFPMVLQQTATYSYDSVIIGIAFLFVSYAVRVFYDKDKVTGKQFIILAVLSFCLAISKFVYAPVVLLLLAIPSDKLNVKHPVAVKRAIIGSIIVMGLIVVSILQSSRSIGQFFIPSFVNGTQSAFYIVVRYTEMLIMSAIEIADFYIHSLVAYIGWYQIYVPVSIVSVYYILLISSLAREKDEKEFWSLSTKVWMGILVVISVVLITLPMAAKFTNPSSETVDNVQGRYFLPLLPFICLGLRTKHITADDSFKKKVVWGTCYVSFLFFGFFFLDLFSAI